MASHFVSLNRGQEGSRFSDFVTGVATSGGDIEIRLDDGKSYNKVDVIKALKAFERFFENAQQVVAAGFVVNG
jgi:hypothetical protein